MHRVQTGPLLGYAGLLLGLAALDAAVGLGPAGWLLGAGCGGGLLVLLDAAMRRHGATALGPADRVTLLRAGLVCGVAALAVGADPVGTLVSLAAVALVLDGVDGRVARRTGTVSALGARFDLEVDAFLILVLSVDVAPRVGWWVLLIGAARYLLVAGRWALPWLRGTLAPRPWCKVVAVAQGVVLTVTASRLLSTGWARLSLLVALALLAESFGREVRDLWRVRVHPAEHAVARRPDALVGHG